MEPNTKGPGDGLTLEDLEVGQVFRSPSYSMNAEEIKAFAGQFDPQPFHMDEQAAKSTFFGELVASGWHTAAITMRLLVSSTPIKGGLVGAGGEISWLRPVRPGDTLRIETEILSIQPSRSRPDRGTVMVRTTTLNQEGRSVQVMTSRMVVPTRAAAG
jgi:acyl dehydratase